MADEVSGRPSAHGDASAARPLTNLMVRVALAAIPSVGGPMEIIYSHVRARQASKAEEVMAEIAGATGADRLLERISEDPYVEALFVNAMNAALRTGLDAKRRLLARAVSAAVLDDAKLEESQLIADVLEQLDVPHAIALARLADEWEEAQRGDPEAVTWGTSEVWSNVLAPVRAALVRTGTANLSPRPLVALTGPHRQEGITDFGLEVIEALRAEGFAVEP